LSIEFGIDFGTTNSACVGILDKSRAIKYTDGLEESPVPSLVIIDNVTGEVFTGREAWNKREELSQSGIVFKSIKSILGTNSKWTIAGKQWTPEMVAAEIFKEIKRKVYEKSGDVQFECAVVAVPVDFTPQKRKSLREAAKLAGIHIKSFVSESTAAVFHSLNQKSGSTGLLIENTNIQTNPSGKMAVFDWGGGTLDISLLENSNGRIKEVAVGNEFLGGDDIDIKLAKWVHLEIEKKHNKSILFEEMPARPRDLLIARCEAAKKDLSYSDIVNIRLNKYGEYGAVNIAIDIDTFAELISNEIEKAHYTMLKTLRKARWTFEDLGNVILVGGSTNLLPLLDMIESEWNCLTTHPEESDWSVAFGAAMLSIKEGEYIFGESLGVVLSDGGIYSIIEEGTPVSEKKTTASFAIVEESETANLIFSDGTGNVLGYVRVPVFGFFKEQIDISYELDRDMVLNFFAKSNKRSKEYQAIWQYPGPNLIYQLPGL
jgi:molecular chaperone DnaK